MYLSKTVHYLFVKHEINPEDSEFSAYFNSYPMSWQFFAKKLKICQKSSIFAIFHYKYELKDNYVFGIAVIL